MSLHARPCSSQRLLIKHQPNAIEKHQESKCWNPHFLDQTARKPKVRLETMAEMKPVQLKVRSDADASATPVCPATRPHTH